MEKYSRYYGVMLFVAVVAAVIYFAYSLVYPQIEKYNTAKQTVETTSQQLDEVKARVANIKSKLKVLKDSSVSVQKKVYAPIEGELGNDNDSLFFTLYNDVLDMLHANSVKIKAIDYVYNPAGDKFVDHGKGQYFVCDVNLELVSNYANLGKLIQEIYQYPYYVKISSVDVNPYKKDKTILLTKMSLRLYSSTEPVAAEAPAVETTTDKKSKSN